MTLVMFAMLFAACDHRTVYDRYQSTALAGWEKNDTLSFAIPPLKDAATYSAVLGVRTTDAYFPVERLRNFLQVPLVVGVET